jgi:hypothetical protein
MYNIKLSQNRSDSVLEYILKNNYFLKLDVEEKEKIKF